MKRLLLICALSAGRVHAAYAQALDIGGIEVRLGQPVDEVLRSLSSYQVQYSSGSWIVSQKVGDLYHFLGSIGATANAISFISKHFDMKESEGSSEIYTRAAEELRRRGGTVCATREVEYTDDMIHGFETQCGPYRLMYYMPSRSADGTRVLASVSVSIRAR